MDVSVQHDAEANVYNLGAEINGQFVPFVTVPGDTVDGRIASAEAAQAASGDGSGAGGGGTAAATSGGINPADYTANDDGTYTRKSDGASGRFTPTGFEPTKGQ